MIRARAGLPPEAAKKITARVPVRIASELGRKEFVLVSLIESDEGAIAFPTGKGSGSVTSFSQADGFLEIDALASSLDAGSTADVTLIGSAARAPDLVIMGSHDVALDVVVGALAERGFSARTLAVGSLGGVAAASRGECDIAPVHLIDQESGLYNVHLVTPGLTLVPGWRRMQGMLFRPGDKRFEGHTAQEALATILADPSALMVNRNAGAGTRVLIEKLLYGARPPGYANQPKSHNAVAAAIAQGRADWGVAIEPVAKLYGLGFLPLSPEHYDFLLVESRRDRPAVQAFLAALHDPATRERIRALGMSPLTAKLGHAARGPDRRHESHIERCCVAAAAVAARIRRRRRRNCAAMAGRCARWRSRPTASEAVSGSFDTSAIRWSLTRNVAEQVMRFHDNAVNAVAWLKDGRIVTAGADAHIAIWTQGKPEPDTVLDGHSGPIAGLAVSGDGKWLASASWDHSVRLWPLAGGAPRVLEGHARTSTASPSRPTAATW